MAVNLRRDADAAMPAANVFSLAFIDRTGRQLDNPHSLLRGIIRETAVIKAKGLALTLVMVSRFFGRFRGGVSWLIQPRWIWRCHATAIISNLGEPFKDSPLPRDAEGRLRAGDLTLVKAELLPPVRPGTVMAFGVLTYARQMHVTAHYDATVMRADEAAFIAADYERRLLASRGEVPSFAPQARPRSAGRLMRLRGARTLDRFHKDSLL
jgi:hypothetical protein